MNRQQRRESRKARKTAIALLVAGSLAVNNSALFDLAVSANAPPTSGDCSSCGSAVVWESDPYSAATCTSAAEWEGFCSDTIFCGAWNTVFFGDPDLNNHNWGAWTGSPPTRSCQRTPCTATQNQAEALAEQINNFNHGGSGTLTAVASESNVTVTGTITSATGRNLNLNIPSGVTVTWAASYRGNISNDSLIRLSGDGTLLIIGLIVVSSSSGGEGPVRVISGSPTLIIQGTVEATQSAVYADYLTTPIIIVEGDAVVRSTGTLGNTAISGGNNVTVRGNAYVSKAGTTETSSAITATTLTIEGNAIVECANRAYPTSANGGTVSATTITVRGNGIIRNTGTGNAIRSFGTVTVENNGTIQAGNGFAVAGGCTVNLNGGAVFANGTAISNVFDTANTVNPTWAVAAINYNGGVAIAYNEPATIIRHNITGTSNNLFVQPAGAAAVWGISGTRNGVSYTNGSNSGFLQVSGLTLCDGTDPDCHDCDPCGLCGCVACSPYSWAEYCWECGCDICFPPDGVCGECGCELCYPLTDGECGMCCPCLGIQCRNSGALRCAGCRDCENCTIYRWNKVLCHGCLSCSYCYTLPDYCPDCKHCGDCGCECDEPYVCECECALDCDCACDGVCEKDGGCVCVCECDEPYVCECECVLNCPCACDGVCEKDGGCDCICECDEPYVCECECALNCPCACDGVCEKDGGCDCVCTCSGTTNPPVENWVKGSGNAKLTFFADFEDLSGLYINGTALSGNPTGADSWDLSLSGGADYGFGSGFSYNGTIGTATDGSIIVTFYTAFLDLLPNGTYLIEAELIDVTIPRLPMSLVISGNTVSDPGTGSGSSGGSGGFGGSGGSGSATPPGGTTTTPATPPTTQDPNTGGINVSDKSDSNVNIEGISTDLKSGFIVTDFKGNLLTIEDLSSLTLFIVNSESELESLLQALTGEGSEEVLSKIAALLKALEEDGWDVDNALIFGFDITLEYNGISIIDLGDGSISITFKVPDGLNTEDMRLLFFGIHINEKGEYEFVLISEDLDVDEDGYFTVILSKFSDYFLMAVPRANTARTQTSDDDASNPAVNPPIQPPSQVTPPPPIAPPPPVNLTNPPAGNTGGAGRVQTTDPIPDPDEDPVVENIPLPVDNEPVADNVSDDNPAEIPVVIPPADPGDTPSIPTSTAPQPPEEKSSSLVLIFVVVAAGLIIAAGGIALAVKKSRR